MDWDWTGDSALPVLSGHQRAALPRTGLRVALLCALEPEPEPGTCPFPQTRGKRVTEHRRCSQCDISFNALKCGLLLSTQVRVGETGPRMVISCTVSPSGESKL